MSLLVCRVTLAAPRLVLRHAIGDTSGDIPLYSLHRIRRMMKKQPPAVSDQLQTWLMRSLIAANLEYKEKSGNDWSCLTSNNLIDAIEATDRRIGGAIEGINDIPKEWGGIREKLFQKLHNGQRESVLTMKQWFESNFESLQYVMDGKIPYPIVLRLRRGLSQWIAGISNPFGQDIEEMIMDVASKEGITAETAEDAWKRMGGTLFSTNDD